MSLRPRVLRHGTLFKWCLLIWLGFLLPEVEPSYPSVIDQSTPMIQQKNLNRASWHVAFHRQARFGIFFPLHCSFPKWPLSPAFMRVPPSLPFRPLFPARALSRDARAMNSLSNLLVLRLVGPGDRQTDSTQEHLRRRSSNGALAHCPGFERNRSQRQITP